MQTHKGQSPALAPLLPSCGLLSAVGRDSQTQERPISLLLSFICTKTKKNEKPLAQPCKTGAPVWRKPLMYRAHIFLMKTEETLQVVYGQGPQRWSVQILSLTTGSVFGAEVRNSRAFRALVPALVACLYLFFSFSTAALVRVAAWKLSMLRYFIGSGRCAPNSSVDKG